MKVGVISLGCAKNLVDTENLLGLLRANDIELVQKQEDADAIIINTILDAIEEKGEKKLIVMGCLTQRYKQDLVKELPEVDRFIAIDEYEKMGNILSSGLGVRISNTYGKSTRVLSGKPWMAYLRIADGCDNRCSYCAIPNIRGDMVSAPQEELVNEAKRLIQQGVKELNLVAQDSSRYGYDIDGKLHLSSLIKELDALEGVKWIRILYLYPDEIPDDLIQTMKETKHVLPYFDIPIQHGNNRLLKMMNRRGSRELILERTRKIREELPEAILRTTLITGFPSETEAEHQDNLSLMKEIEWDHLGAFTYSKEEDTKAYELEDNLSQEEKNRRLKEINDLQREISANRMSRYLGKEDDVLVESIDALTGMYLGRSSLYAPDDIDGNVRFQSDADIPFGEIVRVKYKKVSGHNLIAERLD